MLRLKRIFLSTKTDNNLSVGKEPRVVVIPSISIFISRHGCFEAIGRYIKLTSQMVFSQPLPTIYEAWWNDLGEMLQNLQCFGIIWVFIQKRYQKNFKSSLLFQCLSVLLLRIWDKNNNINVSQILWSRSPCIDAYSPKRCIHMIHLMI